MARIGIVTRNRLIAVGLCLLLWGAGIGYRLFELQVVEADHYRERAEIQIKRELDLSPQRGTIRDRNGNDLAISIEVDSLYANPSKIGDPADVAEFLAPILEQPVDTLLAKLSREGTFVYLLRKMTAAQSRTIRDAGIPGLEFQTESRRYYPNIQLAAHVLGFVNLDNQGGSGLEYQYEELIGGTPGKVVVHIDGRKTVLETRIEQAPREGASLTTTLDTTIQHFAEEEIERTVRETGAAGMSVIVMDPRTGGILAMANYPTFNPNEYGKSPAESWRNRAIGWVYEPGSTFKIATAASAFEEGLANLDEVVDGQNGAIMVHGYRIRDHKPFGRLTVREVLEYSSNVGIIKVGTRLDTSVFADYIRSFGFGQRTGIDLMGEERGLSRPASEWSALSSSVISMGQEIGVTPLQILDLVAAVGNGGTWYRPFVVQQIHHVDGRVEEVPPEGHRIISESTVRMLQEALAGVVAGGTGRSGAIPGFTAAGKTGTAQKIDPATRSYSATRHVASFGGYAPAKDPSIAVMVVVDEPQGASYHGGDVAAPVFGRLAAEVLRYLGVRPDAPLPAPGYTDEHPSPDPSPAGGGEIASALWTESEGQDSGWMPVSLSGTPMGEGPSGSATVPDFTGRPLREVFAAATRAGLELVSAGSGVAVDQWPPAGAVVATASQVQVRFSTETGKLMTTRSAP